MNDELWQNFIKTGRVADYLLYRQSEYTGSERINNYADRDEGFDNKGTDYSGE